jgi:hypothetical protein
VNFTVEETQPPELSSSSLLGHETRFSLNTLLGKFRMRAFLPLLLLLPIAAFADEMRFSVGLDQREATSAIRKCGAVEVTSSVAWATPAGDEMTFWELTDFGVCIMLRGRAGKLASLSYWKKEDFEDGYRRSRTDRSVAAFSIDVSAKKIRFEGERTEKGKPANP